MLFSSLYKNFCYSKTIKSQQFGTTANTNKAETKWRLRLFTLLKSPWKSSNVNPTFIASKTRLNL